MRTIFIHIPKTGGTTLYNVVSQQYPTKSIFSPPGNFHQKMQAFNELASSETESIEIVIGHIQFGVHKYLPGENTYISMLRDPLQRAISYYRYARRSSEHYAHNKIRQPQITLENFIKQGRQKELDNGQTRILAGTLSSVPFGEVNETHLQKALDNINQHFSMIGIMEEFDKSLVMMKMKLGWKHLSYQEINISPASDAPDISPQAVDAVMEYNKYDQILYEHIKEQFLTEFASLAPTSYFELRQLTKTNRRVLLKKNFQRMLTILPKKKNN